MPCDIGYRSVTKVTIPAPQPQVFTEKAKALDIDADLLEKLGIEDSTFLEWITGNEIDVESLLTEALKRALAKVDGGGLDFTVNAQGMLEAKGSFTSAREKARLSERSSAVSNRWQFEILGIVAELLDYTVTITQKGEELVLEAEEAGKSHPSDYIKITRRGDVSEIVFEHFKSRKALDLATAKFLALAARLGVKLVLGKRAIKQGDPFPGETRDKHGHTESHQHGHGHRHDH
ncbi:MAG: hypothetical protein HY455_03115 [Parcubacteria group bacterium]|nr:hypothetical protein [Parcubacteria group bacterium]